VCFQMSDDDVTAGGPDHVTGSRDSHLSRGRGQRESTMAVLSSVEHVTALLETEISQMRLEHRDLVDTIHSLVQ